LAQAIEAIQGQGVKGVTITAVDGVGNANAEPNVHDGVERSSDLASMVKLELATKDSNVDDAIEAIFAGVPVGDAGDHRILVMYLEREVRIRTGKLRRADHRSTP
jgi:nitrogen regulatory protein P-II 1/nitrogen regulatory protein P-II 2